ncbi:hypothetical protein G3R49_18785 [Shewanella sp. WXL01]|uniref:putative metalloprotease CJM1_0395 family protein n=1 Tax=Shewanella sp. WXL01 TaxID=2709721 RepID=UPI0014385687|nr:putative metalloprotease CJM1_0395 family protein [Shewanella sp. WXL01]NKF52607.1 hypothetical protein [Shewanella sp. WXL01]
MTPVSAASLGAEAFRLTIPTRLPAVNSLATSLSKANSSITGSSTVGSTSINSHSAQQFNSQTSSLVNSQAALQTKAQVVPQEASKAVSQLATASEALKSDQVASAVNTSASSYANFDPKTSVNPSENTSFSSTRADVVNLNTGAANIGALVQLTSRVSQSLPSGSSREAVQSLAGPQPFESTQTRFVSSADELFQSSSQQAIQANNSGVKDNSLAQTRTIFSDANAANFKDASSDDNLNGFSKQAGTQANRQAQDGNSQGAEQLDNEHAKQTQEELEQQELQRQQAAQDTEKQKLERELAKQEAKEAQIIKELSARDTEVRQHEQAHASVGGSYAGQPSYQYEQGPDGKRYAVEGEVQIDVSEIPNDPQATIIKMQKVYAAAMAPVQPSSTDIRVAAEALDKMNEAKQLLAEQRQQQLAENDNSERINELGQIYQNAENAQQSQLDPYKIDDEAKQTQDPVLPNLASRISNSVEPINPANNAPTATLAYQRVADFQ